MADGRVDPLHATVGMRLPGGGIKIMLKLTSQNTGSDSAERCQLGKMHHGWQMLTQQQDSYKSADND